MDISYRMVAFNLCESFVNSLTESIQITFLIVLLKTYEYSVPTCTRRNLAPEQTLTKPGFTFWVCLGSALALHFGKLASVLGLLWINTKYALRVHFTLKCGADPSLILLPVSPPLVYSRYTLHKHTINLDHLSVECKSSY